MMTASVQGLSAATTGTVIEAEMGQPVIPRHCDGCSAAVLVPVEAEAVPRRWGDVWWCARCLRSLSPAEIERQTRELSLRGVPLN
jgi:hypothetical protein